MRKKSAQDIPFLLLFLLGSDPEDSRPGIVLSWMFSQFKIFLKQCENLSGTVFCLGFEMRKIIDYLANYRLFKQKNRLSTNSRYHRLQWPPWILNLWRSNKDRPARGSSEQLYWKDQKSILFSVTLIRLFEIETKKPIVQIAPILYYIFFLKCLIQWGGIQYSECLCK